MDSMATPFITVPTATPKELQSWSIGRETTPGSPAVPVMNIPLSSGTPEDNLTLLSDKDLRGDMGLDYNLVAGVEIGSFSMSGDVYLDSIPHLLYNTFGDYQSQLVTTSSAVGTTSGALAIGATSATLAASASVASGAYLQFTTTSGASEVVVATTASTGTTVTFAGTPLRFNHATGTTVTSAPAGAGVAHTFALLNTGGSAFGLPRTAQPVTHTITHYNSLPANPNVNAGYSGYRQYGYWCSGGIDFTLNNNNLFQHSTKGTSFMGQDMTTTPPPVSISGIGTNPPAQAAWEFAAAVGVPAITTGGTGTTVAYATTASTTTGSMLQNVEQAAISVTRTLTPKYALVGQQQPVIIGRQDLSITGTLQFIADDETPLYAYLNQVIGQLNNTTASSQSSYLSIGMGLPVGAGVQNPANKSVLGIQFDFHNVRFEKATLADPDMMQYNVSFRALMNTTDVGVSGGRGPGTVTVYNNIATY